MSQADAVTYIMAATTLWRVCAHPLLSSAAAFTTHGNTALVHSFLGVFEQLLLCRCIQRNYRPC